MSSGWTEHLKICLTCLSAVTQVGLNITMSVLIGTGFRSHAPWGLFLAVALAAAWTASLLHLGTSYFRLVRYINKQQEVLKDSRSALVLPLGAESLAAALGSAVLSGAVVWIAKTARVAATGENFLGARYLTGRGPRRLSVICVHADEVYCEQYDSHGLPGTVPSYAIKAFISVFKLIHGSRWQRLSSHEGCGNCTVLPAVLSDRVYLPLL